METEWIALTQTARLPQTPTLHYRGFVDIDSSDSVTLTVECLLMSYAGPSYDKLLHEWCAKPFNLAVANFFVSAIVDLITTMVHGQTFDIGFCNMLTANICTLSDPAKHVLGNSVPSIICDAEGVSGRKWSRSVFNDVCEDMILDFELHFAKARDPSWTFLGEIMSRDTADFFKQNGNDLLDAVRSRFLDRVGLMWRDVCNTYAKIACATTALR